MYDLDIAKKCLQEKGITFAAAKDGRIIYRSSGKGVSPVLKANEAGIFFAGACVADQVVGKAVALLLLNEGARGIYGRTVSVPAREFLEKKGILLEYGEEVPFVRNREGTGPCPLEAETRDEDNPGEGKRRILEKLKQLKEEKDE